MKKLALLLGLLYHFWHLSAQTSVPILERKVTIKITNQSIAKVLDIISETLGFNFSYGNNVKVNSLVTVHSENRKVKDILDQIFKNEVSYQQIGNHLILQKKIVPKTNTKIQESDGKPIKYNYIITGYIRDLSTGDGIKNVSIYYKPTLSSTLSGDFGYYELRFTSKEPVIVLNYSLNGFMDTSLSISYSNNGLSELNMNLLKEVESPTEQQINVTDTNHISNKSFSNDSSLSKPNDSVNTTLAWHEEPDNKIKISETQIGKWFVNNYQRLSENNIQDSFYRKWQFTLVPPVGTNGNLSGLVTNGFSVNLLVGYNGGVKGCELGGLLNIIKQNVNGAQFAGFANTLGGNLQGAQFAGFLNHNLGSMNGFQGAGFYNFNHEVANGMQSAGFLNVNLRSMNGVQAAGFLNVCGGQLNGVQLSGFMNIANHVNGSQITGFINIAKKVRGSQIGIINVADSVEGATIGIINFIRSGLHQLEISKNEVNYGIAYRSGTRKLYSTLFANAIFPIQDTSTLMSGGWGLGTSFRLSEAFHITLEATAQQHTFSFNSNHLNLQSKLSTSIEVKLFRGFALFGGASLNYLIADPNDVHFESTFKNMGTTPIYHNSSGGYDQHAWVGYQFGIRLF